MSDVTYPYELAESMHSSSASPQSTWNDPQLFQDFVPSREIAVASMQAGPSQAPSWHPTKVFPPEKYIGAAVQVVLHGISRLPMVARVTMIDYRGFVVYDTYVRPTQPVSDYRAAQTGLTPYTLARAPPFPEVQQRVANLLRDKLLVGYALWEFLSVMGLSHPAIDTRDVALFLPFRRSLRVRATHVVPLVALVNQLLARNIGLHGEHPVEHARAAMDLFRSCEKVWEGIVASGSWPCALPPDAYANCFN
ncbi:hypothetical protein BDW22DRAFT_1419045 [Trametopsis cervina]|nr:hypothetical protein BDW22DRAFT_1419045 [Trametopsis cervina]